MTWVLTGAITICAEAVDTETGNHRNVCFAVPDSDQAFVDEVDPRWRRSFAELEYQNASIEQHWGNVIG